MQYTILVVEDEQTIRENIVDILESCDYRIFSAPNGKVGITLAKECSPDLVISDIMMPEVDGYGLIAELRAYPPTAHIPFIFLTAKADKSDIRQGMNLGADDYLSKPFKMNELLTAVESRIQQFKKRVEKAQEASESMRADLGKSIPHEFITPLNAILGFSEVLLAMNQDNPEQLEMIQHINQGAKRLHRMVDNFILNAKLSVLTYDPNSKTVFGRERVQESVSALSMSIDDVSGALHRAVNIHNNVSDDPTIVMSNEHLTKIVYELLTNADKFSSDNHPITVHIDTSYHGQYQFLHCSITNIGRGFTPEQIAQIGAYVQFDRLVYEQQGIGLGIAIVQRMAQLYGGLFTITSVPNAETTVKFSFLIAD